MTTTLSDLLANLSLSPLSTEPIASESLESLSAILSDSRPALLQKLARGGVSKLAERQKLANELARWRKAQRPSQTAPEAPHKTTPPADARATAASQPKIWDKGTAEDYMAAMHLMARKASHDLRDKHGLSTPSRSTSTTISWPTSLSLLGILIDHYVTTDDIVIDDKSRGPAIGSDHYPQFATLSLRENK